MKNVHQPVVLISRSGRNEEMSSPNGRDRPEDHQPQTMNLPALSPEAAVDRRYGDAHSFGVVIAPVGAVTVLMPRAPSLVSGCVG